jgi:hypothetical protein
MARRPVSAADPGRAARPIGGAVDAPGATCARGSGIIRVPLGTCRFRKLDSCVLMVKAAKDRKCNNVSEPLDRACAGRVLPERNVSSHLIIIGGVFRKNSSKMLCVDDNQMISAFAPDRPDQAFNTSVLPGRTERGRPIPNAHRSNASFERDTERSVVVTNEIFGRRIPRERLGDLAPATPQLDAS